MTATIACRPSRLPPLSCSPDGGRGEGESLQDRISQEVNNGYDTYDAAVVAADSEAEARMIYPGGGTIDIEEDRAYWSSCWAAMEDVRVEFLGEAKPGTEMGVIVASFNAG